MLPNRPSPASRVFFAAQARRATEILELYMIASPSFGGFLDRFNDVSSIVILVSSFAMLLGLLGRMRSDR